MCQYSRLESCPLPSFPSDQDLCAFPDRIVDVLQLVRPSPEAHLLYFVRLSHVNQRSVGDALVETGSDFKFLHLLRQHSCELVVYLVAAS